MIKVSLNPSDATERLRDVSKNLSSELATRLFRVTEVITGIVRSKVPRGKTGALMDSWRPSVVVTGSGKSFRFGTVSNRIYARVRNEGTGYLPGGVIQPKNARMLAIPLSPEAKQVGNRPRNFGDRLRLITSKKGNVLLVERLAKRGLMVHWLLRESVKQKGTRYLEASLPEVKRIVREEVEEAIDTAIKVGL